MCERSRVRLPAQVAQYYIIELGCTRDGIYYRQSITITITITSHSFYYYYYYNYFNLDLLYYYYYYRGIYYNYYYILHFNIRLEGLSRMGHNHDNDYGRWF